MKFKRWERLLLPLGLGLAGAALLLRVGLDQETDLFSTADFDILLLLLGLSLALQAAVILIVREGLQALRRRSRDLARAEALAEHRRFLQRLDHELKNPLTALRAGLGSLAMTITNTDQQRLVQTLEVETQRLSRLVSDLRKLTELETKPIDVYPIHLPTFWAEVVDLEHERLDLHDRQVEMHLPADSETVPFQGDQDLLLLAIHNLLDNAFKFTRPNDTIRVSIALELDEVVIEIQDNGLGIAEAELSLVWEELYRGDNAQEIPGNGIGLALVKAIVERHDGTVHLYSQVGVGTTVTLRLPVG